MLEITKLALYAKDAYKSGERNKKERDAQRKNIFATLERYVSSLQEEDKSKHSTISLEIDRSFVYLDNYLHNYCNPREVPEFYYDFICKLTETIKSEDISGIDNILSVLELWNMVVNHLI